MIMAAAVGAVISVVAVAVWHVLLVVFSGNQAAPSHALVALAGAVVGALVRGLQARAPARGLHTPAAGAWRRVLAAGGLAAIVWLGAAAFRPFGLSELSGWGLIGAPLVWLVSAYTVDAVFRTVPPTESLGGEIVYASVNGLRAAGFLFFTIIVLFPFYFMVASSLKSRAQFLEDPSNLSINLSQGAAELFVGYVEVLTRFNFARYIFNSTFVAISTVVLTLIPAILGAYAVTRLKFPGRDLLSRSILLIYMFPAIVLVIPLYSVFSQLGLRDTLPGLLVVYPAMTIPVALYMLRSYFMTLPRDIEESGLIDGCTRFEVIWRITLPLSVPALASVALYVFMIAWNEFLFAFMFLDSPEIFTLSRGVVSLNSQEVPRQFLMAGAVIITVPIMFIFFWFERFLVGGLAAGGVKG
jgi:multiple sugar transport system permease protein